MDKKSLIPDGYVDTVKDALIDRIREDPVDAWEYLKSNPVAILALSRVKDSLKQELEQGSEYSDNINQFFDEYERHINYLFSIEPIIDKYGLVMTAELLSEKWRRNNQQMDKASFNDIILDNMYILNIEAGKLRDSMNDEITSNIVSSLNKRVNSMIEHEEVKAERSWDNLSVHYEDMIDRIIAEVDLNSVDKLPPAWHSLLAMTTFSLEANNHFQRKYSELLIGKFRELFDDLPEELKYAIAPYIIQQDQKKS